MTGSDAAARLIREVPGQRRVSRTLVDGEECVTRVLLHTRISPTLGPLVEKIVLRGHGSMLGIIPEELQLTLEGYRVAARLPPDLGPPSPWTHAVAAGVDAEGHVAISTAWIEGTPLHHVPVPPPDVAETRALDALRILVALHDRLVTYGDFKSENLVLRPDGTIALIDLDTLREVAEPTGWAPTRDLTRSWAAPEQEREQRTYLASDLWSWARLVEHLFPEGAPAAWQPALAACRLVDPLRRPRTSSLLSHLELGTELRDWHDRPTPPSGPVEVWATEDAPAGATERVPEGTDARLREATPHGATERVPETTGDLRVAPRESTVPREATAPLPAKRTRLGCLWWGLGVVAAPFVLCAGLFAAWDASRVDAANDAAADALAALKANKTRPELNKDRTQREALRVMAEAAWDIRATPRTSAVRALATVWAQGWQDAGRTWSEERYQEGLLSLDGLDTSREPEALLARATLDAAACRLDPLSPTATVHCRDALDGLAAVRDTLPDVAEHHWLRVEAAWTEVLVRAQLVAQASAAGLPEAETERDKGRALCAQAEEWLVYAPVNGPELLQDCLRLAGGAGAMDQYLHWADLLLDDDLADGTASKSTLWHLYASAGDGCDTTTVDKKRGDWVVKGPSWCVAVGHASRHCLDLAASAAIRGRMDDPLRPWSALDAAIGTADPLASCVR